jgi:hypothetical protein
MPDSVIRQIEAMATRENQDKVITFYNRSGDRISDSISALYDSPDTTDVNAAAEVYTDENDDENDNYTNGDNECPGTTLENQTPKYGENPNVLPAEIPEVPANTTAPTESTGVPANEMSTGVPVIEESTGELTEGSAGVHPEEPEEDTYPGNSDGDNDNPPPMLARTANEDHSNDEDDENGDNINYGTPDGEVCHPDSMTPSVQRTHGLRPRKPRDYSHMFSHTTVMHHAMTQYSLRK